MEALLVATGVVALAEIGDKTQLLAFLLAARFRRPWPIIIGIFVATLANHALAGGVGVWLTRLASPEVMRWVLGLSFIAMAAWMLKPDEIDDDVPGDSGGHGVFVTTLIAFFLAEMADKTQIATIALAARYDTAVVAIVIGTTIGMMIANVPAVVLGDRIANRIPVKVVHAVAALIFAALGIATLLGAGESFGI
jgi:putative Ca2+/H+ antiporter (TMEM165/GDT1 family)